MHRSHDLGLSRLLLCGLIIEAVALAGGGGTAARAGSRGATSAPESVSLVPAWSWESNSAGANAGYWSSHAGDVNGDGYDDVLVGAIHYSNGQSDEGKAYLFLGSASGLSSGPSWTFEGNQAGARCGETVDAAGDVNGDGYDDILVGAPYFDNGQVDEGRAFLFLGSPSGPSTVPSWIGERDQTGGHFGFVGAAGDVNGDGFDDVLVAGQTYDNGEVDEGLAALYLGSAAGLSATPSWTGDTDQSGSNLLAHGVGDVNGDGYDDIILNSSHYSSGQSGEGKAFLYFGSPSGPGATPFWTAEGDQAGAQFAFIARGAGDVNSDGYDDVLLLSDLYDDPETSEGAAFLWLGGPNGKIQNGVPGTPANADWRVESNESGAFLRWGGAAGDFDVDGFPDVVVGIGLHYAGQPEAGRILVFRGGPTGLEMSTSWFADGTLPGERLGWTVDGAGDVNGDGAGDILAGTEFLSNGQSNEGGAFVFYGFPVSDCVDDDRDGYGSPGSPSCPGGGAPDCDDHDPAVHPGAAEQCNGVDDDCDEAIDDGNPGGGASCDTGQLGACASGSIACVAGSLTCLPLEFAIPEVCDGADNDCDGLVDEGVRIQAVGSTTPSTLNVNSQGSSFTVGLTLNDMCDPSQVQPLPGELVGPVHLSRAGSAALADPLSIACPAPDGSTLFERGIVDNPAARNVSPNGVTLRFNLPSDGECATLDGDRQEVVALVSDVEDGSVVLLCVAGIADGADFEACMPVTVRNHGNR